MKTMIFLTLTLASLSSFASSNYNCKIGFSNYILKIESDRNISLSNNTKSYECVMGSEDFPGTGLEIRVLNCNNRNELKSYYFTQMSDELIILSTQTIFPKDYNCNKI